MHHNDLSRTGANLQEISLTPANVNVSGFGKLFSHTVDGKVYAQPLYVSGITVGGQTRNVVYVCTDSNSLYAFDADNGSVGALWHDNFGPPVPNSDVGSCGDMAPQIGITGTPAIDKAGGTLYVDSKSKESGSYFHRLHAIDLATGAEKFSGPVVISASANGKNFNALRQHQRPGLVLLNGNVYIGYGSSCDTQTYYGWLLGYNATTLKQVCVFNVCPGGSEGAIWSSGMAPAVDASGNIFVMTGNGTFDANSGGSDYGDCFIKLSTANNTLSVLDWFCPSNQASLSSADKDLGSGGPLLIPGTSLVTGVGKEGVIYLINQNNMGHFSSSTNHDVQQFAGVSGTDRIGPSPVYWQGPSAQYLYFSTGGSKTKAFTFNGSKINTSPVAQSSETQGNPGGLSISANGSSDGILWVVDSGSGGTLRAYNAAGTLAELWNSQDNSSRDGLGTYVKFSSPTIANGKVYVGTSGKIVAYGLLNTSGGDFAISASPSSDTVAIGSSTTYTVTITPSGGFTGNVSLSASGVPANMSASFSPGSISGGSGSSTMTVVVSNNAVGNTYTLTITGTSGNLVHSTTVQLVVPDFTVSATPSSQTVSAGNNTSYTVNIGNIDAFSGTVNLSASGLPSGASASFNPSSVQSVGSSTLTVSTGSSTPAGNSTLTINGSSGVISHNTTVGLTVTSGGTLTYEAENLSYTTNGAIAALQTDTNASGGFWVALEATATGPYIQFTIPNVPAGTYQLQMKWKGNGSRGILSLSVDGTTLGSNLDQYSATPTYPTTTFGNVTLSAGSHLVRLTVVGKNAAATSDWLSADAFYLTPTSTTLNFEAESLSYTTNGAIAAVQTDANSSGGKWIALEATSAGPYIEFTLPNIPAGTYQLSMEWKGNNTRGILSLSVDGTALGSNLDQYSAAQSYPTTTFGNVALSAGNHLVRLTVTGKNASSSNYWLSADKFTLVGQ